MIIEKRQFKRITCGFAAEIIHEGKSYVATIENMSEKGVYLISVFTANTPEFVPGSAISLKFRSHTDGVVTLHCTVKRFETIPGHGLKYSLGLEIIDPPWNKMKDFL